MKIFNFEQEYTKSPFARDETHDKNKNGKDFEKRYLSRWINEKQEVLIKANNLNMPFSDSFVDASFCKWIRENKDEFNKYITIDNETEDEKELHNTIKEVLDRTK
ncbi:hypothetical protein YN70_005315 [Campylobacter coli]|uniref:hypothetical protein n=1 Tax=Campylobacter coli TaxID=195 RepID=UPI000576A97E|nr:hypothetical protein [Campylobacter coli]EAI3897984.1 hypothetical protein [Campylobacter coli]EAJ0098511.1 hypothetical protein [Campylobacter coli]EAJ7021228.1 hypothetical protein [Campylobacter coli]EAW0593471.1 hypothetical protein [Campylobacter coli]EAW7552260.1 hypothetical protein [Campylobacter coli]